MRRVPSRAWHPPPISLIVPDNNTASHPRSRQDWFDARGEARPQRFPTPDLHATTTASRHWQLSRRGHYNPSSAYRHCARTITSNLGLRGNRQRQEHGGGTHVRAQWSPPDPRRRADLASGMGARRPTKTARVVRNRCRGGPLDSRHCLRRLARRRSTTGGTRGRAGLPALVFAPAAGQADPDACNRQEADLQRQHRVLARNPWPGVHHSLALPLVRAKTTEDASMGRSPRRSTGSCLHSSKRS